MSARPFTQAPPNRETEGSIPATTIPLFLVTYNLKIFSVPVHPANLNGALAVATQAFMYYRLKRAQHGEKSTEFFGDWKKRFEAELFSEKDKFDSVSSYPCSESPEKSESWLQVEHMSKNLF